MATHSNKLSKTYGTLFEIKGSVEHHDSIFLTNSATLLNESIKNNIQQVAHGNM